MTFRDLRAMLSRWLGGGQGGGTRRPDGGTSCYRPVQRRNPQEENLAREKAAEYAAGQGQVANLHTGFTGMNPPASGAVPAQSTQGYTGYAAGWASGGSAPQQAAQPAPAGQNISYMPGVYAPDAGNSYTHVEHIFTITSLRSCYEAIECMKNEETLIVTLDVLGSDGERVRCQDMLAGAAFTLGCSVRNLQSLGVVIIAPAGVKILPEMQARSWMEPQMEARPRPENQAEAAPVRQRRASQNPMGWGNAAGGMNTGYNPYTGAMPAAAGGYGAYGGY